MTDHLPFDVGLVGVSPLLNVEVRTLNFHGKLMLYGYVGTAFSNAPGERALDIALRTSIFEQFVEEVREHAYVHAESVGMKTTATHVTYPNGLSLGATRA